MQREHGAQEHRSHADRRPKQEGRSARTETEPVVVDPASDWNVFAKKPGSSSQTIRSPLYSGAGPRLAQVRAADFRGIERLFALSTPVQYEGEESSRNIFTQERRPTSRRFRPFDI
jgi:hypothetical protein